MKKTGKRKLAPARGHGKGIRAAREKRGLSQPQLADKLGVTRAAVGGWERGADLTLGNLRKIARVTKTPIAKLVGDAA